MTNLERIQTLDARKCLAREDWVALFSTFTQQDREYAAQLARAITRQQFGNQIFFRGIIEFSNICKNDCLYCGIRKSNGNVHRYRLSQEDILQCCAEGYRLGYRTFVLQSGEDGYWTDEKMVALIAQIKHNYPDCAVTLSIGERSRASYEALFAAGADRYLLRHETAQYAHYQQLHPAQMSFEHRMQCLETLKQIGYQVGCGMMVGAPYQSAESLAEDMEFMGRFQPAMVGIGPFLPHQDTPFAQFPPGSRSLTLFCLSLTRIMLPDVLLPSTTALGTLAEDGRIQGILAGCNVVMPNLSPQNTRKDYMLYDHKAGAQLTAEESLQLLRAQVESLGMEIVVGRGDHKNYENKEEHHD